MNKTLRLTLGAIIILGLGGYYYWHNTSTYSTPTGDSSSIYNSQPVACTMDAKICPDGSSVGRTGPNCEFAACPYTSTTAS